ncbi:cobalamin B12-binding domain-containing protein [Gracilibacillus salinarum]|uniref:Cobalamin-dependent protein n=1 Tax=Gracilibacillus salinarum TaxID=2932255 RepID=A0ABY4GR43_9BACI|nr:cobalamin-dependent protein [Gracilibacillus salinarum]UOQ86435.1 cobalamin-dependent protein [Gracilibacillus salinarum]
MQDYQQFAKLLLDGDDNSACDYLFAQQSDVIDVFADLVTPAMQYIGELWQQNKITVADEHLATSVCEYALTQYIHQRKPQGISKKDRKMMLFCIEEEQHALGMKMIAAVARNQGWDVRQFGANLPLQHVLKSAAEWQPDVIGMSAAIVHRIPTLVKYVDAFQSLSFQPEIVVGGRVTNILDVKQHVNKKKIHVSTSIRDFIHWLDRVDKGVDIGGAS